MNLKQALLIALGVGAMAVPAAAVADSGGQGHGHGHGHGHAHAHGAAHGHGHGHNPTVTYVFKGTYGDPAVEPGVVTVNHGNGRVRKGGFVGVDMQFDLSNARIVAADTTGDGNVSLDDVRSGDRVVVQARLPKLDPGAEPFAAQRLVDQSTADDDDTGDDDSGEAG